MTISDAIGFAGVAILLLAFLLNLLKVTSNNSRLYTALNLLGAGMACAASVMIHYMPFIILEGVWTIVSMVALILSFKQKAAPLTPSK